MQATAVSSIHALPCQKCATRASIADKSIKPRLWWLHNLRLTFTLQHKHYLSASPEVRHVLQLQIILSFDMHLSKLLDMQSNLILYEKNQQVDKNFVERWFGVRYQPCTLSVVKKIAKNKNFFNKFLEKILLIYCITLLCKQHKYSLMRACRILARCTVLTMPHSSRSMLSLSSERQCTLTEL